MNIYALEGFKVVVSKKSAQHGNEGDTDSIKKHLVIGKKYTVKRTTVHSWSSEVELQEVPGVAFNTVNFIDVHAQSLRGDKKHPDWATYHR